MIRIYAYLFILLFAIISPINAINQLRIYVPADSVHGVQELRAGHTSEILIEITCDKAIKRIGFIIEENKTNNAIRAWAPLSYSTVYQVLYHHNNWSYSFDPTDQDAPWPDTLTFRYTSRTIYDYLQAGTHLITRLTVFPDDIDVIDLSLFDYYFIDSLGDTLFPEIISEPITIVEDYDCNQNGIQDYIDIRNNHLIDCNDNGQIDLCEGDIEDCNGNGIADACDFDCNFNGVADDCETFVDCNCNGIPDDEDIASGFSEDNNGDGIPDNCEDIPSDYYRLIVPPNEYHGPQEMLVGFEEEIYILAHTNYELNAAVVYADFDWSTGSEMWTFVEGTVLIQAPYFDLIQVVNYYNETVNTPDTLEGAALALRNNYPSPGDFKFIKMTVIPTDTGTVVVSNSRSRFGGDSSLFRSSTTEMFYVPLLADDIKITYFPDCNNNLILDSIDIVNGHLNDCNNNFIADQCEPRDYPESDCDNNNLIDACELANDPSLDCNNNGIIDFCDIALDSSLDCNRNDILDSCEIAENSSLDCNNNGILDACEISSNPELDCNSNDILDGCDILFGTSNDCNHNQLPDECDLDCNFNGIPDECETFADCNCNARPDNEDIASGWSNDSDMNGKPDECEGKAGTYVRIYAIGSDGLLTEELPVNIKSEIIFSITTDQTIKGFTIPISPLSEENNRMWDYININDVEYLYKDDMGYLGLSLLNKQTNQWPDTLLLSATKLVSEAPFASNTTLPIIRLHVTPTQIGLLDWAISQFPPDNNFSFASATDNISYPMNLRTDNISIGCCRLTRGNIDNDPVNQVDISDLTYLVQFQFGQPTGPEPTCFKEADLDNNKQIDIGDLVSLVSFIFQGGSPPHSCQE